MRRERIQVPVRGRLRPPRGVTLLALLLALALGGIGVMAAVDVWALTRQRAQEEELLFAGDQYRQAIQRYYFGAPAGTPRVLPMRLEDLLEDTRYPVTVRHLRRLYPDPLTGQAQWRLVRMGGRIAGVYSGSERATLKREGFAPGYEPFAGKTHHKDWVFAISPQGTPTFVLPPEPGASNPVSATPESPRESRRSLP